MKLLPIFDDRFEDNGKSKENLRIMRGQVASFLTRLLNYADEAFEHCFKKGEKLGRWTDCSLMSLARHTLVYLDGITVHFSSGSVECCPPLIRSMLEATLGIAHIAQAHHEERALAYNLSRVMRNIKFNRMGDATTNAGKALRDELTTDAFIPDFFKKLPPGIGKRADDLETSLNADPTYAPILAEWNRLKGKQDPEWFTLFGGAKPARSVRSLAKNLNWLALYAFVYKPFSDSVHAGNALEMYVTSDKSLRPLRYPARYADYLNTTFVIFIHALERLARFYDDSMGLQVRRHTQLVLMPELVELDKRLEHAVGEYK